MTNEQVQQQETPPVEVVPDNESTSVDNKPETAIPIKAGAMGLIPKARASFREELAGLYARHQAAIAATTADYRAEVEMTEEIASAAACSLEDARRWKKENGL